jgi:hypothetical protein
MEHVIENVKIAENAHAYSLTDGERDLIQEVREVYNAKVHVDCTACGYCISCPNGVDIPKNLNMLNEFYIYISKHGNMCSNVFIFNCHESKCLFL